MAKISLNLDPSTSDASPDLPGYDVAIPLQPVVDPQTMSGLT